ncbi:oligosaccharide flippase family protein [Alteromonas australica]|uniref:Polysaccharide biosynthesis protein C-terminal domain-containing protein n=1 Tax=Alteromonas australica TaxID=589873 RepID=A0A075P5T0_9ALTE|nr:oligosaccharide flippase family protein [Alteromonas australica]AIF98657.1 hypothetical protein EP13_08165 [Alteromonas australica]
MSNSKSSALSSSVWTIGVKMVERIFALIIYIFLARYLTVEEFGAVAFAMLFLEFITVLIGSGVKDYLLTRKDVNDTLINTCVYSVFGITLTVSLLFYLITTFIFSDKSTLIHNVLLALLFLPSISSFNIVQTSVLQHRNQYKSLSIRSFIATLISGLVGLYFAFKGYGAWALVINQYCSVIINTIILQYIVRYRPRLEFSILQFKECIQFSLPLLGAEILNFGAAKVMELFVTIFHGVANLAILNISRKFTKLIQQLSLSSMRPVVLGYVSKSDNQSRQFSKFVGYMTLFVSPVLIGVGVYADFYIAFVFGEQWKPATEIVEILSFSALAQCLTWYFGLILISNQKSKLLFNLNIIFTAFFLITGVSSYKFSFHDYITIQVIAINIISTVKLIYLIRKKYIQFEDFRTYIIPAIFNSLIFSFSAYFSRTFILDSDSLYHWLPSVLSIAFAGAAFFFSLFLTLALFKSIREDFIFILNKFQ